MGAASRLLLFIILLNLTAHAHADVRAGLVGEWRFDSSKNANQDTSGNGLHATFNSRYRLERGKACNGLGITTTSRFTTLFVRPNAKLNITKNLTITAWINKNWDKGRASVVDKGSAYAFHVRKSTMVFYSGSGTNGTMSTRFRFVPRNWYHIAVVHDGDNQRKYIYINGILRRSASASARLFSNSSNLQIGNTSRFSSSQFPGIIDELRIYNTALNNSQITAVMNAHREDRPCYYKISHSGINSTCEPAAVTITAHNARYQPVAPAAGTAINLLTSIANDGWSLKKGNGTFRLPNSYSFDGKEKSVEFWLTKRIKTNPPHLSIDIAKAATEFYNSNSKVLPLEFSDKVLRFYADDKLNGIGTQIAGKPSNVAPGAQILQLRSTKPNSNITACGTMLNGQQKVRLAYKCVDPGQCQLAQGVQITDAVLGSQSSIRGVDYSKAYAYSDVDLYFNEGVATFAVRYQDAGKIIISARYDMPGGRQNSGASQIVGNSNIFASAPAGLCVEPADRGSAVCERDYANCSPFKKAGEPFDLKISAVAWQAAGEKDDDFCVDNQKTANFSMSNIALSLNKVAPIGAGTQTGSLGVPTAAIAAGGSGTAELRDQTISEVGVFNITATSPPYFGHQLAASTSINIGRFTPFDFAVDLNSPMFEAACGTFSYIGQPIQYVTDPVITVTARNYQKQTTKNYQADFFKLNADTLTMPAEATDTAGYRIAGHMLDTSMVPAKPAVVANDDGTARITFSTPAPGIGISKAVPVAPFDAEISLAINVVDEDDIVYSGNPAQFGSSDTAGGGIDFVGDYKEQRWGRLLIKNNFGPVSRQITLPIAAEYYSSNGNFVTSLEDQCTSYTATALRYLKKNGFAADPIASGDGTLTAGVANPSNPLLLSSTENKVGFVDVSYDADFWFRYDWDNNGLHDNNPSSRATWGVSSGREEFIYVRE